MQIRTKLAVVLVVLAVVLSGVVFGAQELFKQQAADQVQTNVNETAALTADQVDSSIRNRQDYVGQFASRPAVADFNRSGEHLQTFLNNSRFHAAVIVTPNGTVVDYRGSLKEEKVENTDFGNKTYVEGALERGTFIAEPAYNDRTGQWLVTISAEIRGSDGRQEGVFLASLPPTGSGVDGAELFNVLRPLETNTSSVGIVTTVDGEQQYIKEPDTEFEDTISGTATIQSTGWEVVVTQDRSVVDEQLEGLALIQAVSILLILGGVMSLGIWEYRNNLSQTEDLLAGFGRLRAGEYDQTLSLTAAEEWRKISDGFNDLASDLQSRERAIREREQRLEVLNRVLRHNLKNDMSVILSWASLLPEISSDPDVAEAAEKITTTAQRLVDYGQKARQVEEAMTRTEDDRISMDLVPVVEDAMSELLLTYPEVETALDCPESAQVFAIGDVEYAVENVCENAFEHNTSDEPFVSATVERQEDSIEITITDNGPGIPSHELEVIEEGTETSLEHGSGVGLWLVYWTVKKSNGTIEFEENEPTGTVVRLELPRSEQEIEHAPDEAAREPSQLAETDADDDEPEPTSDLFDTNIPG